MATLRGSLVCLDTNILLSATNRACPDYEISRSLFRSAISAGCHLAISGQILREYLVVTTRPTEANGYGLDTRSALRNAKWFRARTVLLDESEPVLNTLERLVSDHTLSGERIHDANIAALALVHRAGTLITLNTDDFAVFERLHVLGPGDALELFRAEDE